MSVLVGIQDDGRTVRLAVNVLLTGIVLYKS